MSKEAMAWVVGMYPTFGGKPDTASKHILLYLAVHANATESHSVWRSEETLLRELCIGRAVLRSRKKTLQLDGYLTVEERRFVSGPRKGQRTADRWLVNLQREPDTYEKAAPPERFVKEEQAEKKSRGLRSGAEDELAESSRRNRHHSILPPPSDRPVNPDLTTGQGSLTYRPARGRGRRTTQEELEKKKSSSVGPPHTAAPRRAKINPLTAEPRDEGSQTPNARRRPLRRSKPTPDDDGSCRRPRHVTDRAGADLQPMTEDEWERLERGLGLQPADEDARPAADQP